MTNLLANLEKEDYMRHNLKKYCILCRNKRFTIISNSVRDSKKHKIIKCLKCGHFQIYPIPSKSEYMRFYDKNMQMKNIGQTEDIAKLETLSKCDIIRRSKIVSDLINSGSILDIGAGHGFFVKNMINKGYAILGTEISQNKIPESLKNYILNIDVLNNKVILKNKDCITLFFLLEHLVDPIKACKLIRSMLSPGGVVVIEVPNLNCSLMKINKSYRKFFWQTAHVSYFNDESLKAVLKKAGYNKIEILYHQRYSIDNFMNWMINNKPQIDNPSFKKPLRYGKLDEAYRSNLIAKGESDTLIAIARI